MRKYEIYLPLKYNDGKDIEPEKIKQIKEELVAKFGAITGEFSIVALSRNMEVWRSRIHRRHHKSGNRHFWRQVDQGIS
jgi:hypothetical protein